MNDSGKGFLAFLIVIMVVFILAVRGCSNSIHTPLAGSAPSVLLSPSPSYIMPEQPLPTNGYTTHPGAGWHNIMLTIKPPAAYYHLLKLKDGTGSIVLECFVYPDSRVDTYVPAGRYTMQFAAGTAWYGWEELFGPNTEYGQFTDTFVFDNEYDYTLELIPQINGNLGEKQISAEDFR